MTDRRKLTLFDVGFVFFMLGFSEDFEFVKSILYSCCKTSMELLPGIGSSSEGSLQLIFQPAKLKWLSNSDSQALWGPQNPRDCVHEVWRSWWVETVKIAVPDRQDDGVHF
uniref:Tafazzin n=1 Tax=Schistocephalus solidus TaxID=70667 RepID=A0A0X3PIJ5_SCHSO